MESVAGVFPDPALLAFRDVGPRQPLYRVVFKQRDVWANCGLTYAGSPGDTVVVEVRGVSSHCTQASTAPVQTCGWTVYFLQSQPTTAVCVALPTTAYNMFAA